MYDYSSSYGESCYRLMARTGQFIYLKTRGYLDIDRDTNQVRSFVCHNILISEEEGKQLIHEMKKKFAIMIQDCNYPAIECDEPAVENPVQLERAIRNLVTFNPTDLDEHNLSSQAHVDHEVASDAGRSTSSPPLAYIAPKLDSIKVSIDKSVKVIEIASPALTPKLKSYQQHQNLSPPEKEIKEKKDDEDEDEQQQRQVAKVENHHTDTKEQHQTQLRQLLQQPKQTPALKQQVPVPAATSNLLSPIEANETRPSVLQKTENYTLRKSENQPTSPKYPRQKQLRNALYKSNTKRHQSSTDSTVVAATNIETTDRIPPLPSNAGYFELINTNYNKNTASTIINSPSECKPFDYINQPKYSPASSASIISSNSGCYGSGGGAGGAGDTAIGNAAGLDGIIENGSPTNYNFIAKCTDYVSGLSRTSILKRTHSIENIEAVPKRQMFQTAGTLYEHHPNMEYQSIKSIDQVSEHSSGTTILLFTEPLLSFLITSLRFFHKLFK